MKNNLRNFLGPKSFSEALAGFYPLFSGLIQFYPVFSGFLHYLSFAGAEIPILWKTNGTVFPEIFIGMDPKSQNRLKMANNLNMTSRSQDLLDRFLVMLSQNNTQSS